MARVDQLRALHEEMRACRLCVVAGYPIVPRAVFSGAVGARVMVVGQAPGATESASGIPFCGPSGRRLFRWLADAGWREDAFRRAHYITAVTKCFPGKGAAGRGDRAPSRTEQALCAPFLEREIEIVAPDVVIAVGRAAIERHVGAGPLDHLVGKHYHDGARVVVPLPHPSGANLWLNRPAHRDLLAQALSELRDVRSIAGI